MTDNRLKDPLFQFMMELTQDELDIFMENVIKQNEKEKTTLIKYAQILGNDLLATMEIAITMNDLISVAMCIKCGIDINTTIFNGNTFIHLCAMKGHSALLESFIMKKVDINKKNDDDHTALELAMYNQYYDCVYVLVKHGAYLNVTISNDSNDSESHEYECKKISMSLMEIFLNIYEPKLKDLFELIVSKTDVDSIILSSNLFFAIKKQIILKNYDIIETILLKFPKIVNIVANKHTLLQLLITLRQTALVHRLMRIDTTDLNPQNTMIPYLHGLCATNDIENIIYILEKNPNSINEYCSDGRTVIDYVLLKYSEISEEHCINTIRFLINKSKENMLNHRNTFGFRTLETAIQFTSPNIIELLINNHCNINEPIINPSAYYPSIVNNDPLAFASQIDKIEIIEILLKHNVTINIFSELSDRLSDSYNGVPTSILSGIYNDSAKAIEKLMLTDKIYHICNNEPIKQKILNFCMREGTGNKEIMKHFMSPESIALLKINTNALIFNKIEKDLEQYIDSYQEDKINCLIGMYDILMFLKYCSIYTTTSDSLEEERDNMIILTGKYFCAISNDYFKILKHYIIHIYLKGIYMQEIKACFQIIERFIEVEDPKIITALWDSIVVIRTNHLHHVKSRITNLLNIIKSKLNSDNVLLLDETSQYSFHSENNERYIRRVLSPLMYPEKMKHYDEMYEKISGLNCIMSETSTYILVKDNKTNIISLIFNDGNNKPTRWFNFYNHNIGKNNKCDPNHMFPFALDKKLSIVNCYEKYTSDMVNKFGKVQLCYFSGMLIYENKYIMGCYEYFIDATGSLFHRFFKPSDQISDKIKKNMMCNFSLDLKSKHKLARELVKTL